MRYLGTLLLIGLVVYCVIDIVRSQDDERLGVHPALWVLLVVLFPLVGGIVWLAVSRTRRAGRTGTVRADAPAGPLAPDDDPEFLWRLDQERRRREQRGPDDRPAPDDEPRDQTGPAAG